MWTWLCFSMLFLKSSAFFLQSGGVGWGGNHTWQLHSTVTPQPDTQPPNVDVGDFDELRQGYEFIYHDTKDLLLTIHHDKCFFMKLTEAHEGRLNLDKDKRRFEDMIISAISNFEYTEEIRHNNFTLQVTYTIDGTKLDVHFSSFQAVRDSVQDRLANFHCMDKQIYTIVYL